MGDIGGRQGLKTSIRIKPKTSPLGTEKTDLESWLVNQPDILEIQRKTEFDKLKEILQNWLNPEDTTETSDDEDEEETVETPSEVKNDLPWEKEDSKPNTNYELKTKKSKADKFDELFED